MYIYLCIYVYIYIYIYIHIHSKKKSVRKAADPFRSVLFYGMSVNLTD